jgi:hypothetical protein
MGNLEFIYRSLHHCSLLDLLKNKDINQTLAYMVDFKQYKNLKIIPNAYSIEVSNDKITIVIILMIGFELEEYNKYNELKSNTNVHIVSMSKACNEIFEFKKFRKEIKLLDFMSLFFMTLSRTNSRRLHDLVHLRNLSSR